MAFNVAGLTAFTNETKQALIKKAVLTGKTMDYVTVVPGIKYKETLNILENTVTIAAASCGWNPAGSVAFTQREITVIAQEVKDALCEKTLEKYFLGQSMKMGSPKGEMTDSEILAESYVEKIKVANERNIWLGDTAVPGELVDGFLKVLTGEAYVPVAGAAGPHTTANIVAHVDLMVAAAPEVLSTLPDLTMFMSVANFRTYIAAIAALNYFHIPANVGTDLEYVNPINGVKFVGMPGLSGSDKFVLTYASNLVIGTDLTNEEEDFKIWYSQDNDEVRVNIQFKLGTQVQFPDLIVLNQA